MSVSPEIAGGINYWFVGACYGGTEDQTERFVTEGFWEINNPADKEIALVKSMAKGDRIAIKSTYTRKKDLPFDNRGNSVSVMMIKAIGTIEDNPGDGTRIIVKWTKLEHPREWYFYTYWRTIWRVLPGKWELDALIEFTFEGKSQDVDRFRNAPFWRERYGDISTDKLRFRWTRFYEEMADKLLAFKDDRANLLSAINDISKKVEGLGYLQEQYPDKTTGFLKDICPFTFLGMFNRGIKDANRKVIAYELAKFLGVEEEVPESFEGIPVLNNQKSWFFGPENERKPDDIDALWNIFSAALRFAGTEESSAKNEFVAAYDDVTERNGVGWNLTMGLYWIRPWAYATLDSQSRRFIEKRLRISIGLNGPKKRCNAEDYLKVLDTLETRFKEEAFSVHSFPELSLAAWQYEATDSPGPEDEPTDIVPEDVSIQAPIKSYSVDDILADGCFIERSLLEKFLQRLRTKKNLILQGPPGTGKTWLAKRLAYALMGECNDNRMRAVQFHPNLSYEDFVRGWRPCGDGKLSLVDGPFLEMVMAAMKEPSAQHVMVIEEINRGNPAQIFGEMLTLMEADKRTPAEALELCYRREDGERVYIPDNLYVIGTMNIADRSLALVDLALRRRFAFIELEPKLGKPWQDWVHGKCGIDKDILSQIESRVIALNEVITADSNLGRQFRIGHSYITPPFGIPIPDAREWFKQVVETEIGPLLDEYWFDAPDKSRDAQQRLIEGL